MKLVRTAALLGAAALLAIGAIACGDDDDEGDDNGGENTPAATQPAASPTEADDTPATADETPVDGPDDGTIAVVAQDFVFNPSGITVASDEEVTISLQNDGELPHTLTVFEDDAFTTPLEGATTGNVNAGATGEFTVTFEEPGQHAFRCQIHPDRMVGIIVVN